MSRRHEPATDTFAVITGGGTAGHVLPALAIADALVAAGHEQASILYVGARRGAERELLPPTGYDHALLDVVGLQRSLSPRNLAFLPKLVIATARAVRLLGRRRPRVVVNVGGYASFPASFAALLRRIPVVVVSYDRRPGLVSRLIARRAAASAVAFEGSTLPRATYTGAPVRRSIATLDRVARRPEARRALDLPADRFVIGVTCGSLGAQAVNDAVAGLVERWAGRFDVAIHHAVGQRFLATAASARDGSDGILYRVTGFERRIDDLYAAADLMITRAGAGTIAELAATGTPAIVVPWPGAAEHHQLDNARMLSDAGAAVLLEQHQLTVERLAAEIERLLADDGALAAVAAAAYASGAMHRSTALVELVEDVVRTPSSRAAGSGRR